VSDEPDPGLLPEGLSYQGADTGVFEIGRGPVSSDTSPAATGHIQLLITRCRGSLEVARPRGRMKSPMASPRAWQTRSTLRSPRRAPRPWMPGARRTPTSGSTWAKRTWGRANWPRPNRKGVSYVLSATSVTTTFVAFFMLHSALPTLAVGNLVLGCREPGGIAPRLCLRVGRDSDG
jgi:hypothetical protein